MTDDDDSPPSEDDTPPAEEGDTTQDPTENDPQADNTEEAAPDGGVDTEDSPPAGGADAGDSTPDGGQPEDANEAENADEAEDADEGEEESPEDSSSAAGGQANISGPSISPNDEPEFESDWAFPYYHHFAETCLSSDKRQVIIETLCEVEYGAFSTQGLAELVEDRLESEGLLGDQQSYDANNLNQVLPELEPLGLVYRAPKFEQDDEYVIIPMDRMLGWLDDSELKGYLDQERLPDSWGTHLYGRHIEPELPEEGEADEEIDAGESLPAEALISAVVSEYGLEDMDAPSVEFAIGSLSRIRDSEFELDAVVPHLSVEETLPEPDDGWGEKDDVSDYAIFVRVTDVTGVYPGLRDRLKQILGLFLASAQGIYERIYDDDGDPQLSDIELDDAITAIEEHEQMSEPAIERFDLDVAVLPPEADEGDDDACTVVAGLYRRSGKDEPQEELT